MPLDVIFSGCTDGTGVALTNDLNASSVTLAGIALTGAKPQDCYGVLSISGNEVKLSGDITRSGGGYESLAIKADITLTQDAEFAATVSFGDSATTTLNISNHTLTLTGSLSTNLQAELSGSGQIVTTGEYSSIGLYGESSSPNFTGTINASGAKNGIGGYAGALQLGSGASIVIGAQATLVVENNETDATLTTPITLQGSGYDYEGQDGTIYRAAAFSVSSYTDESTAELTISNVVLEADANYDSTMNADDLVTIDSFTANGHTLSRIDGSQGRLVVAGSEYSSGYKTVELDEDNEYDYGYTVGDKRRVVVTANWSSHPFTVNKGGILAGTAQVGEVTVKAGGKVAPGLSPGTLTTTNIEWEEGGVYEFEIGSEGGDKIIANGTVTLGNGTLSVVRYQDYAPKAGDIYTLVENDGSDAVSGTFKDLPEGATFSTSDSAVYRVNYGGGDGNDVTLTVVTAPKVPNTGFNMLKNNPVLTLLITTGAAMLIATVARRRTLNQA